MWLATINNEDELVAARKVIAEARLDSVNLDVSLQTWIGLEKLKTCSDTDNGLTDSEGYGCDEYTIYPSDCGKYDTDDFKSNEMCCACNGG